VLTSLRSYTIWPQRILSESCVSSPVVFAGTRAMLSFPIPALTIHRAGNKRTTSLEVECLEQNVHMPFHAIPGLHTRVWPSRHESYDVGIATPTAVPDLGTPHTQNYERTQEVRGTVKGPQWNRAAQKHYGFSMVP